MLCVTLWNKRVETSPFHQRTDVISANQYENLCVSMEALFMFLVESSIVVLPARTSLCNMENMDENTICSGYCSDLRK